MLGLVLSCSVYFLFVTVWLSVPVQSIAWKDSSLNDLLCVKWDIKPYTLTRFLLFLGVPFFVSFHCSFVVRISKMISDGFINDK